MNPKMNEAAGLYLKEMMVLEDARDTLLSALTSLWLAIDERSHPTLESLATTVGGRVAKWDNKSNPGYHERWIDKKEAVVFKLLIEDPILTRSGYRLTINCTNEQRAKLNRLLEARGKFETIASASGIQPFRWTRSNVWSVEIPIDVDDLNQTVNDIVAKMSEVFKTISDFMSWFALQTPVTQILLGTDMKTEPTPPPYGSSTFTNNERQ